MSAPRPHQPQRHPAEYPRMTCPHCAWPAIARSSQAMSILTRHTAYHCTNYECGHTFAALTEIVYTISPSATPDPSVRLPLSKHVRRSLLREQLDSAQQADHQARNTPAYTPDLFAGEYVPPVS